MLIIIVLYCYSSVYSKINSASISYEFGRKVTEMRQNGCITVGKLCIKFGISAAEGLLFVDKGMLLIDNVRLLIDKGRLFL